MRLLSFSLLLLALLSGCAQQPQKVQPPLNKEDWAKRQEQILNIRHWQATGKLGVKVPNDGGSASINWQQHNSDYQIDLNGPLGLGKMTINGKPDEVSLIQGGKPPQSARTAEELLLKNTGWRIPVAQLAYWVRGLPAPKAKVTDYAFNEQGGLSELQQAGWKISYGDYLQTSANIPLPGRITAEFNEVRLTLVIREWQIP
ncbi:MAG TPA: lipoprotein insertase outer membrane protein LolB [Cellvibrio sp.]|nr:lipoprotein insertase outer membrane protein LolB [Cellvibrio sp.]